MMLVDVPTSVTSPPRSAMNDIGISRSEGELSSERPSRIATGISAASAPTFLLIIANRPVNPAMTGTCVCGVRNLLTSGATIGSITPDRAIAAETTSAPAMTMTTSLVKPLNARFSSTTPVSTATINAPSEMASYRKRPEANSATADPTIAKDNPCSKVIVSEYPPARQDQAERGNR